MATFAGLRGTGSFAADERPKNFREFILWTDPNGRTPLNALMARMKTESVNDPEFSWWEEKLSIARVTTSAASLAADTTIDVVAGALQFVRGDVLQVEPATEAADYTTTELVRVASVQSDTAFTVVRGFAGTTPVDIANGASLTRVGSATGEGTLSPDTKSKNPEKLVNFTQIFKTAFQLTNTTKGTKFRTGDALANERHRKAFDHSEKLEQAWFWGKAHESVDTNGMPMRTTGGLREFITTHRKVYTAPTTINDLIDTIAPIFDFHANGAGDERIAFVGNAGLNVINKLVKDDTSSTINFNKMVEKVYGMNMMELVIPQGRILLKTHPLLNIHPVYRRSMFIISPPNVIYRPFEGRDTKVEENIQPNDADYRKDQWLTEAGIEVRHEETMAYIGNLNVA